MQDRSGNEAESKGNPSGPQAPEQTPTFKAKLVLDAFTGAFCDRRGWAQLTLRTVDGEEFECFLDGIVAKGFSDRLLGLAGKLILQSHGESQDLRPLHELDDDDADADRPLPPNLPAIAPQPHKPGGPDDPGTLAKPPSLATALPSGDMPAIGVTPAEDEATKEFLESFGGKPDEYFAGTFARKVARASLAHIDHSHPDVQKVRAQLDAFPEDP